MNEEKSDKPTEKDVDIPIEKDVDIPWGDRAVKEKAKDKLLAGFDAVWSSRVMLLIVILLINGIFLGSTLMSGGSRFIVRLSADGAKVTHEEVPNPVPEIGNGASWTSAIGYILVIFLVIRCLVLMFTSKSNSIDTYLTYQPKR